MGHLARLMRVLRALRERRPELDILLLTDAPDLSLPRSLSIATVQLPRFRFTNGDDFKERPEFLSMPNRELRDLRARLILEAGRAFAPDLVLADTNPHGKRDELKPLLTAMRAQGHTRTCLMMRDIPCPPDESFKLNGPVDRVRQHAALYDLMLIAGDRRFFDPVQAYGWPEDVARRVEVVGFVTPPVDTSTRQEALAAFPQLQPNHPLVVASFGGGWEIESTLEHLLQGLEAYRRAHGRPAQLVAVTGPACDDALLEGFRGQAREIGGVVIERFLPDFPRLLAQADLAILQAGSTAFQLLETDIPILLTVRDYKSREQNERARRLAQLPSVWLVERDSEDWADAGRWFEWGLEAVHEPRRLDWDFNGVANAAERVLEELSRVR